MTLNDRVRQVERVRDKLKAAEEAYHYFLVVVEPTALHAALSAYVAHQLPGSPLWLNLVGPASCGKTETLEALRELPGVHDAATLTEAALLSASPAREKAEDATGGLLMEIGDGGSGVILCKDFTSVLSEHRDTQKSLLAALREVYDGSWVRRVGTDGGRSIRWSGRVSFLGATTPVDTLQEIRISMGERFLFHRMKSVVTEEELAWAALNSSRSEDRLREAFHQAVHVLVECIEIPTDLPSPPTAVSTRLVALSRLVVRARAVVQRDERRDITAIHAVELPPRLVKQLLTHYHALLLIGCTPDKAWAVVRKTGLDSVPYYRVSILGHLARCDDGATIRGIVTSTRDLVEKTVRRVLQDLEALRMVHQEAGAGQRGTRWYLTEDARKLWSEVFSPFAEDATLEGGSGGETTEPQVDSEGSASTPPSPTPLFLLPAPSPDDPGDPPEPDRADPEWDREAKEARDIAYAEFHEAWMKEEEASMPPAESFDDVYEEVTEDIL